MSHWFYDVLGMLGYTHPVHPVLVHVPAGMSIGALGFWLLAVLTKQAVFRSTAYHVAVFALAFTLLAIPVGIFDWQRFYGGAWFFEIQVKAVLAAVYLLLIASAVVIGRRCLESRALPVLYLGSVVTVGGLGFFGGQLVYHGFTPEAPVQFKAGRHVFESHCSGCHRRGENIIEPNMPLRNAPQLHDFTAFLAFIRDPRMPDGSPGVMPKFGRDRIGDLNARELFDYLNFAFVASKRPVSTQ